MGLDLNSSLRSSMSTTMTVTTLNSPVESVYRTLSMLLPSPHKTLVVVLEEAISSEVVLEEVSEEVSEEELEVVLEEELVVELEEVNILHQPKPHLKHMDLHKT